MEKIKDVGKTKASSKETPRTTPVMKRSKHKGEKTKEPNQKLDTAEITSPLDVNVVAAAALKAMTTKSEEAKEAAASRAHQQREELKDKISQSIGATHQHGEANSKAPEPNHDRRIFVTNPEPLNRGATRGNRSSDPDFVSEDSYYFDSENRKSKQSAIREDHQRAMEDLRTEMMVEIKQLKARRRKNRRGDKKSQHHPTGSTFGQSSHSTFDSENQKSERSAIRKDHQCAMDDLRTEMMAEIKQLKARQGGGRLE
ncbi:uncharacterized protein LOC113336035 [Papaver somniferum]|uniref:uncharacterized protein LOC113336035 n=1 Tax=Papaver somniferum TaxID=3469 RepID=UPI000E7053CC|nr:uncharacterized protein LOC113336035 [Papaver somniferum]